MTGEEPFAVPIPWTMGFSIVNKMYDVSAQDLVTENFTLGPVKIAREPKNPLLKTNRQFSKSARKSWRKK